MTMTHCFRWWALGNFVWLLAVPLLFGIWLSADVDAQYGSGVRTNGSSDSVSLPVAAVALTNGVVVLVLNAAIALFLLVGRIKEPRGAKQSLH